jgi:hypothetical protein
MFLSSQTAENFSVAVVSLTRFHPLAVDLQILALFYRQGTGNRGQQFLD